MYTDESQKTLCDAVEDLVMAWPGVSRKTTFGYPSYVADGVQNVILDQVENGVAVRMALLYLVSGVDSIQD